MKFFITRSSLFLIPILLLYGIAPFFSDGYTDAYALKFSDLENRNSLIIGTSRASQGCIPFVLDSVLGTENKFFNFAFTITQSPYGTVYSEAIKKKITEDSLNTFILTVDPWSISIIEKPLDNQHGLREEKLLLAKVNHYNKNPNYDYFTNSYGKNWLWIYVNKFKPFYSSISQRKTSTFLHNDGWLEINVPMDVSSIHSREARTIQTYTETMNRYKSSEIRINHLVRLVKFLSERGKVFLVRLPVSSKMLKLENKYMPEFDSIIRNIAISNNVSFFNFVTEKSNYYFTDGNHLHKESAKQVSISIAQLIKANSK